MSDDLNRLVRDLQIEADLTPAELRGIVGKGALNIKRDWRKRASGISHARRYPLSISYDLHVSNGFEAVIGPEDTPDDQGFLGHVLEYGGAHNAPRNDGGQALDAEAPRFEQTIRDIAGRYL